METDSNEDIPFLVVGDDTLVAQDRCDGREAAPVRLLRVTYAAPEHKPNITATALR